MSGPAENTDLIFQNLKYNPISGETVPLNQHCSLIWWLHPYQDRESSDQQVSYLDNTDIG
jgi:hypothetical protein